MTSLDAARDYHRLGWALVPIAAGLKRPRLKDWPNRQFRIADFDPEGNLAIRLGQHSGNLVDGDLDCEEAIDLAPLYLADWRDIRAKIKAVRTLAVRFVRCDILNLRRSGGTRHAARAACRWARRGCASHPGTAVGCGR